MVVSSPDLIFFQNAGGWVFCIERIPSNKLHLGRCSVTDPLFKHLQAAINIVVSNVPWHKPQHCPSNGVHINHQIWGIVQSTLHPCIRTKGLLRPSLCPDKYGPPMHRINRMPFC